MIINEFEDFKSVKFRTSLVPGRWYYCPQCPKKYRGKYTLQRHLKLECGKKPTNGCSFCGQMFFHRHRLLSHIASQHINKDNDKQY